MLCARPAKTLQHVIRDINAAGDRDFFDRIGHIVIGNRQRTMGNFFDRLPLACGRLDFICQRLELGPDNICVQRLIPIGPKHMREHRWNKLAGHQIRISDRERPAAPVAGGTGIGAGAFRADLQPCAIEANDRTTPGCHRVNMHHRRAHPDPSHLGLKRPLKLAGIMGNIG